MGTAGLARLRPRPSARPTGLGSWAPQPRASCQPASSHSSRDRGYTRRASLCPGPLPFHPPEGPWERVQPLWGPRAAPSSPSRHSMCSLGDEGARMTRRQRQGHGGVTWMSEAAAGICLLKCFCLCFCWTFRAKPEPRIPCKDRRQAHALQTWEWEAGWVPWAWLRAAGPADQVSASRDPACGEQAGESECATCGCLLTGRPPPPPAPRAQRRLRGHADAPPTRSTYRRECKERDGEDREAGGDGLPHPRLRHLVPVADGGDRDLQTG